MEDEHEIIEAINRNFDESMTIFLDLLPKLHDSPSAADFIKVADVCERLTMSLRGFAYFMMSNDISAENLHEQMGTTKEETTALAKEWLDRMYESFKKET